MQIFNDIFDSIFKPKAYNRFLKYKSSKKTAYIFLLPLFRVLLIILATIIFHFFASYLDDFITLRKPLYLYNRVYWFA